MDMRMVMEILTPSMEHRDDAELGTQVLGIGGDGAQRLGRRTAQDGVHHGLVLERDLGDG